MLQVATPPGLTCILFKMPPFDVYTHTPGRFECGAVACRDASVRKQLFVEESTGSIGAVPDDVLDEVLITRLGVKDLAGLACVSQRFSTMAVSAHACAPSVKSPHGAWNHQCCRPSCYTHTSMCIGIRGKMAAAVHRAVGPAFSASPRRAQARWQLAQALCQQAHNKQRC
jgi:hypothetical protein